MVNVITFRQYFFLLSFLYPSDGNSFPLLIFSLSLDNVYFAGRRKVDIFISSAVKKKMIEPGLDFNGLLESDVTHGGRPKCLFCS